MKKFLMDKHQWTEKTWKMIDREFIKMTMKFPVSPSAKSQWFKLMHDLQPLGRRKKKMLDTKSDQFSELCPCCNQETKDQLHFILCEANPKRSEALIELHSGGSKFREHHNFVQTMTACIVQWLNDPNQTPSGKPVSSTGNHSNHNLPAHMISMIQEALLEQETIGWLNMFRGFISIKWCQLASTHMTNAQASSQRPKDDAGWGSFFSGLKAFSRQYGLDATNSYMVANKTTSDCFKHLRQLKSDTTTTNRIYWTFRTSITAKYH
jgi:hypothetical protein